MPTTADRALELTLVGDAELVERIYSVVGSSDDPEIMDELYWLLTEAFERFAPTIECELARVGRTRAEFDAYLEGVAQRHRARLATHA